MIQIKTNINAILKRYEKKRKAMNGVRLQSHKEIAVMLDRWVLMNFRTQGAKVGRWKPFQVYSVGGPRSPYKNLRGKRQIGRGRVTGKGRGRYLDKSAKLLRDTGALQQSFTRGVFYNENDAGIGSDMEYSEYHEKGMGFLPKRRMLPNIRDISRDIKRVYERHIQKAIKTR